MKRYRFLEEADAEFQESIRYYDEQVPGLGDKFIADVENIITQIREYPQSGKPVSPESTNTRPACLQAQRSIRQRSR